MSCRNHLIVHKIAHNMKNIILTFLLLVYSSISFSQEKQDRILYFVDSIPILDTPDDDEEISNEDIAQLDVFTNLDKIKALGREGKIDKIIYITTKAYLSRSAEVKRIPTTKNMDRKNGIWYPKNSDQPYTGKFIDYFVNGKIQEEGVFKDGKVNGIRTGYYPNGNKSYFYTYTNGITNGESEEYFINGKLKQKGSFLKDKEVGLWQDFYSTGKLKRQSTFENNKQDLSKEETKFYGFLNKGITIMREGDYAGAIKKFNEAAKLNAGYADLYFYRGTAKLNTFDFDNAISDFDNAIALEPLYMEALSNRAFARLRKYEFKDSKTLSKSNEVTVTVAKDNVPIPKDDLDKICSDLKRGFELGDRKTMIIDAMKRYCNGGFVKSTQ
ncbi:MORN repeat variant [compost metagenome]